MVNFTIDQIRAIMDDLLLQDKPSLSVSSHIGISSTRILLMLNQRPIPSLWESERERDLNKNYQTLLTTLIKSK